MSADEPVGGRWAQYGSHQRSCDGSADDFAATILVMGVRTPTGTISPMDIKLKVLLALVSISAGAILAGTLLVPERPATKLDPAIEAQNRAAVEGLKMRKKQEHPVTPEMQAVADNQSLKAAPDFKLVGLDGQSHTLASVADGKPLLVFFIEKECPCCLGAKVFFERFYDMYAEEVSTVGIINAGKEVAEKWKKSTQAHFPILMDPDLKTIKAFNAERGAYVSLIAEGKIVKQYAGYGEAMLQELNARLARLAGIEPRKYDSSQSPEHLTSGCVFPEPTGG